MVDANNLNVAKYIIHQIPIGHLEEGMEKFKNMAGEKLVDSDEVKAELVSYEENHLKHIPYNNGKIVLSKETKDGENYYYDQSMKIKIKVNPLSDEIVSSEEISMDSSLQKAIDAKMKEFKSKYYKDSITAINGIINCY